MERFAVAAIFAGADKPLYLEHFTRPELTEQQLLVEVSCCTLCGSDLHSLQGKRQVPVPTILGHEVVGRVVEWGGSQPVRDLMGRELRSGDRVTWGIAASCGECFYCRKGIPQKCESLFKYGHELVSEIHPLSGGLATHCHLKRQTPVLKISDELPDEVVAPANCATATVAGALRVAGGCRGDVVLIQGAGMLGLTAAALCAERGARRVLITDVEPKRLAWAAQFGATDPVSVRGGIDGLVETVRSATEGRGVDLVLELTGNSQATELGLRQLRIGGRLVLVGAVFPAPPLSISAEYVVRRLIRIEGLHNYRPDDLVEAVQFLEESRDRYPFERLVEGQFPLPELTEAARFARDTGALRVAIRPRTS
jgi:putative phosphonate catabolism associated alcohol dehydrogenase